MNMYHKALVPQNVWMYKDEEEHRKKNLNSLKIDLADWKLRLEISAL